VTETILNLLESIKQRRLCRDIAILASEAAIGSKSVQSVLDLFQEFSSVEKQIKFDPISDNIQDLLNETVMKTGLRWRLNCLNRSLGSLRPGYFGYIYARPDSGKTSFLADQATFMAEQAVKDNLGPVLYFCNEELGQRVKLRCIQAAFGVELHRIISNPEKAQQAWNDKFQGQFLVFHNSYMTYGYVENICKKYNPSLIIIDQMDKIKGFNDNRDDLRLGQIYEWGRGLCNLYGPMIGACQADGTAEGIDYLNMGHTSGAKCLEPNTNVLMFSGEWKKVKDIIPGEQVMGPDSLPRNVLSTSMGKEEMFKVTHKIGGDYYIVNKSHILALVDGRGKSINIPVTKWKPSYFGYRSCYELSEKSLPIDPYFLGLWLGDGGQDKAEIT
ncbi:MAG: Hint domain-containing homing endonuclease, partial [Waterburya sp.]